METLAPVPIDADFQYLASTEGNIFSWDGAVLRPVKAWVHTWKARSKSEYMRVNIYINGQRKQKYVHRLVCRAFHGPPPFPGAIVRHGPNGSLDNRPPEIKWGTQLENQTEDRQRDGNYNKRGPQQEPTADEISQAIGDAVLGNQSDINTDEECPF